MKKGDLVMHDRVLFLDIDGVLNHETFYRSRRGRSVKKLGLANRIDQVALFCLYDTLQSCAEDIDIVMSSTWRRRYPPDRFNRELYDSFGVSLNVIDVTGGESSLTSDGIILNNEKNYLPDDTSNMRRGIQIVNWLAKNDAYKYIAALDDDRDIPSKFLIKTDHRTGFNAYTVDLLRDKLNLTD